MRSMKNRLGALLSAVGLSLSLMSCDSPFNMTLLTASPIKLKGDLTENIEKRNDVQTCEPDEEFKAAQTAFALNLLKQSVIQEGTSNLLLSPYSVMQALAMSAAGAESETRSEIEQVLGGIPSDLLNAYLYTFRTGQPDGNNCKMLTANSVWYQENSNDIRVKTDYLSKIVSYYNADAYQREFDQSAINDINQWIDAKTAHMIQNVVKDIDPLTRMFLVNACVFDAKWEEKYKKEQICDDVFYTGNGTAQTVQMMNSKEKYALTDTNAKGFVKPYQDGRYAFAALLPDEGVSVNDYIAGLTPDHLQEIFENRKIAHVAAGLPKFSGEYGTDLKPALIAMGMNHAFDAGKADFSNMTESSGYGLYIASVQHNTRIEVDERGTKAATATAVRKNVSSADPIDLMVTLNRPFLYFILDLQTNLPIFTGVRQSI